MTLPRTSFQQWSVGIAGLRANIQAGDLVFFNANGPGASHVGIATSNSTVISATSHGVREHQISGSYWGNHYIGARAALVSRSRNSACAGLSFSRAVST